MTRKNILYSPISSLGFSMEFCLACQKMEVACLDDILRIPPPELVIRPGFSYHWLAELSDYLAQKGLLSLLQPLPGTAAH